MKLLGCCTRARPSFENAQRYCYQFRNSLQKRFPTNPQTVSGSSFARTIIPNLTSSFKRYWYDKYKTYVSTTRVLKVLIRRNGFGAAEFLLRFATPSRGGWRVFCIRRRAVRAGRFRIGVGRWSVHRARSGWSTEWGWTRLGRWNEIVQHVPIRIATRFAASSSSQQIVQTGIPSKRLNQIMLD